MSSLSHLIVNGESMFIRHQFSRRALIVCFIGLLLTVATCINGCSSSLPSSEQANALFDEFYMDKVMLYPERQTALGIKHSHDSWNDYSQAFQERILDIDQSQLKRLEEIDRDTLDGATALSYDLYRQAVENSIEDYQWRHHSYPVNQMFGVHANIPSLLINQHVIASKLDADAYIARVKAVPTLIDQLIEDLTIRADKGIIAPAFVFPYAIQDINNIIQGIGKSDHSSKENALIIDFRSKLEKLPSNHWANENYINELNDALVEQFAPAYKKLSVYLESLANRADGSNHGVWSLPNGAAYYAHMLQRITTTRLSPDQVHQIGLDEVARIHAEMRGIMRQVNFDGNLQAFFSFMRSDSQFFYANTEEGRGAYLAEANKVIDNMKLRLDELFYTKPKAELYVKAIEPFRQESFGTSAYYQRPAPDGSRPGVYYANLYRMENMPKYKLEALAYHEALPGHHMQVAIAQELENVPKFRRFGSYTAYLEGWGLYSEFIPKEMGLYDNPYSNFGRLSMELWRACRLVVDTGLHHKRWTREEGIDYLNTNTASTESANVNAVERYLVWPGQATAYKIGMIKILELREKAREALGDQFDIRAFHEVVLRNGSVPLDVLEQLVDAWIGEKITISVEVSEK